MSTTNTVQQRLVNLTAGDSGLAQTLQDKGFTSAQQIMAKSEAQFVRAVQPNIPTQKAQRLYQQARDVKGKTILLWAAVKDVVASPHFNALRVNNIGRDIGQYFEALTSYQDYFFTLSGYDCLHCQSLFGPSAYLVELLKAVDLYITDPNPNIPEGLSLDERRPDIALLDLTCENTDSLIPFLAGVNDILVTKAAYDLGYLPQETEVSRDDLAEAKSKTFQALGTTVYPFNLPYHQPLSRLRPYLGQLKAPLAAVYETFGASPAIWAREYLQFSPEQETLLITPQTTAADLNPYYGYDDDEDHVPELSEIETFLYRTDLAYLDLQALLTQNLSQAELETEVLPHQFYINQVLAENVYLALDTETETITNLDLLALDRINRFVRLAHLIGWSFADLDWVLTSLGATEIDAAALEQIAHIKRGQAQSDLPLDVLCSFWHDLKTTGVGQTDPSAALFDRIFNSNLHGAAPYHPKYADNPLYTDPVQTGDSDNLSRLTAALRLTDHELTDLAEAIWGSIDDIDLDVPNLSQLFRLSQMLGLLGLSLQEYQLLLAFLEIDEIDQVPIEQFLQIRVEADWVQTSGLSLWELDYIINDPPEPDRSVRVIFSADNIPDLMTALWQAPLPDIPDEPTPEQEQALHEHLAAHFGFEISLFMGLTYLTAKATGISDYLRLLLTPLDDPNDSQWDQIESFLTHLSRLALLAQKLSLTESELKSIADIPQAYDIADLEQLRWADIKTFHSLKAMLLAFQDTEDQLLTYFAQVDEGDLETKEEKCAALASITGWPEAEILTLITDPEFGCTEEDLESMAGLSKLKARFDQMKAIGVKTAFIGQLLGLQDLSLSDDDDQAEANWATYEDTAQAVVEATKAKYDHETWTDLSQNLSDPLLEQQRDVLAPFVSWERQLSTWQSLSEYLLLDVEMTSCADTSPIKQATLSVQTYLQRCRMGLEAGVTEVMVPEGWWDWLLSYRLWEAERKIFLYPENYLEPDLRTDKSALCQQVEQALLQGDITLASVEEAYRAYFDGFEEVAQLQLVETCRYRVADSNSPEPLDTLFLFGKTATEPPTFYYRRCLNPSDPHPSWTYWTEIQCQIQGDWLTAAYAFNRLFLFWVEQKQVTESSVVDNNSQQKTHIKAALKYTFLDSRQNWKPPQTLVQELPDPDTEAQSSIDKHAEAVFWQQIYALPLPETMTEPARLLTMFGEVPQEENSGEYAPLLPATTLTSDLRKEEKALSLLPGSSLPPLQPSWETAKLSLARDLMGATSVGHFAIFAGGRDADNIRRDEVDIYNAQTDEWEETTLSEARLSLGATSVGHLALFAGGANLSGASDVVDIYNAQTGGWTTTQLSQARNGPEATSIGHLALFAGGNIGSTSSDVVDIYNAQTDGWTTAQLSLARYSIEATSVGHLAIFAGGDTGGSTSSDVVDIYNAQTGQWTTAQLSEARSRPAATSVGHLALFAGGNTGATSYSDVVDIYNAQTGQWTTAQLSQARGSLAAMSVGHLALFAGGGNRDGYSDVVDIYNAQTDEWTTTHISEARTGPAATSVGHLVLFAGGFIISHSTVSRSDVVDILDCRLAFKGVIREGGLDLIGPDNILRDNYYPIEPNGTDGESLTMLENIPKPTAAVSMVRNQADWFTFDHGDEAFLTQPALPALNQVPPINESLSLSEGAVAQSLTLSSLAVSLPTDDPLQIAFTRLSTNVVGPLSQTLFAQGLEGLLTLEAQLTPELDFDRFQPTSAVIKPPGGQLDFEGAYGPYFWEVFFHIPFLVAKALNTNQQFEAAQQWYHTIFDPTIQMTLDEQGQVAYWPIDEGAGQTIHDKMGVHEGSLQGTATWEVYSGPASFTRNVLAFDGSNNYVQIDHHDVLNLRRGVNFTLSAWLKTDVKTGDQVIAAKRGTSSNQPGYQLYLQENTGYLAVILDMGETQVTFNTLTDLADEQWHHVALVVQGRQASLYLDGVLDENREDDALTTGSVNNEDLRLGASASGDHFEGYLAEVRLWAVARTAVQLHDEAHPTKRFWRFLPFRNHQLATLEDILEDSQKLSAYNIDPTDPHAIARLRPGTYERAIIMKYIDNLIDWGDYLFTQDSWESISQATTLYFLAADLLGPRPHDLGPLPAPDPLCYQDIRDQSDDRIPAFLLDLEMMVQPAQSGVALRTVPLETVDDYFCVPQNEQFIQYWERVEDRLFKIRHCQNIEGVTRQLALFQPPLDPALLVQASAAGLPPSSVLQLNAAVPHYRFSLLLERAKTMTQTVIQLGSTLLSALEKQDAEALALLRNSHETTSLTLLTQIKEHQLEQLQASLAALQTAQSSATARQEHYQGLIDAGLSSYEQEHLDSMAAALISNIVATALKTAASIGYAVPQVGSPFAMTYGGQQTGAALNAGAAAAEIGALIANYEGQLSLTMGGYQRRDEDWQLQSTLAKYDIAQIEQQIQALTIQQSMAEKELDNHHKSIEQSEEVTDFLQSKFTNQDLYQWMVGRLGSLYFQTYQVALDMAWTAQRAYQYELTTDQSFIQTNYWDSLKQGLLAGEGLLLSLHHLEKAYLDDNQRRLEIEKSISLLQYAPEALLDLKETGQCQFSLSEQLFDYSFPGHYCRQIKSISLSIPAVVGPYQNISATLTQTGNKVLLKDDIEAVKFLLGDPDASEPDTGTLRQDWRNTQQIALSRGLDDRGMFVLDFRDDRYLPFEGTGAISDWTLKLRKAANPFDFNTLTDVIINVQYTALDGGDTFSGQVTALPQIAKYSGYRFVSLKQSFPSAWHDFMNPPAATKPALPFTLTEALFPLNLQPDSLNLGDANGKITVKWVVAEHAQTTPPALSLNGQAVSSGDKVDPGTLGQEWSLTRPSGDVDAAEMLDVILILPFTGDLDWS